MKVGVAIFVMSLFVNFAYGQRIPSNKELAETYRQYVLARCIYFAFGEEKTFSKEISLSVYYAAGNDFGETSHSRKLDSLAKQKLNSIMPTQVADYEGAKPILIRCIEYYESKELKIEILKILAVPKREELMAPKTE